MACDERAHTLGLKPGIALADARARIPELHAVAFDPVSDKSFLLQLATHAIAFTPTVALDEPNGLALDITGCAHLFDGEEKLTMRLEKTLNSVGVTTCRMAVAETPDMARALARFALQTPVFATDDFKVHTLPVAALECSAADTLALKRAGLKTISDIAERPSVLFTARFSQAFTTKLARLLGEENPHITPLKSPPVFSAEYRCAEPVTSLGYVEIVLAKLAENISQQLSLRDQGGRLFESVFVRTDGMVRRLRFETSEPTRNSAMLMRLHHDRLEALADPLECGCGFDLVRFEVLRSEPYAAHQIALDAHQQEDEQVGQLIDRLSAKFGRNRVLRLRAEDTHIPERAQCLVAASADAPPTSKSSFKSMEEGGNRPFLLYSNPLPIEVGVNCDDELGCFRWRRVMHKIARIDGPERISDEWWRKPSGHGARDYYRVECMEGRRFWVFRTHVTSNAKSRWFLHGLFP